jgi:hypothetical protein
LPVPGLFICASLKAAKKPRFQVTLDLVLGNTLADDIAAFKTHVQKRARRIFAIAALDGVVTRL